MIFPMLQKRQEQTLGCSAFGGLERRPGAALGLWRDERNLSADRSPLLSVRRARENPESIDGNELGYNGIIAFCGGEHPVLLDGKGYLWCGGNKVMMLTPRHLYFSLRVTSVGVAAITPAAGDDSELGGGFRSAFGYGTRHVTLMYTDNGWMEKPNETLPNQGIQPVSVLPYDITDFGLTWHGAGPYVNDTIDIDLYPGPAGSYPMVRMGAYVILLQDKMFCNVEKLASGAAMTAGPRADYGNIENHMIVSGTVTLTMCDIDGNALTGVVAGSTEPLYQQGYWLDTSVSGKSVLKEWSAAYSAWISVPNTFVKIDGLTTVGAGTDTLLKGDTVKISVQALPAGTDAEVAALLDSYHYIYSADMDSLSKSIVIAGILPSDTVTLTGDEGTSFIVLLGQEMPDMDFLVEAGNRLWGCRYSPADNLNEIYASALGDFRNWNTFQGLATDSWTASRGTPAPFTGAATLSGQPLFFREESLEKVFPASAGAHQIVTYNLEGVEAGSADSMVVIEEQLFYKSRHGVCVYAGTLPVRISECFGDWLFRNGTAARHGRKYVISMEGAGGGNGAPEGRIVALFDLATGDWHLEEPAWNGMAITWKDALYYLEYGKAVRMDGATGCRDVKWWAETEEQGLRISTYRGTAILAERKWVSRIRLRYALEMGAAARILISYDDGPWVRAASLHGNRMVSSEANIFPRRCDHFRLRLEGKGGFRLWSMTMKLERGD